MHMQELLGELLQFFLFSFSNLIERRMSAAITKRRFHFNQVQATISDRNQIELSRLAAPVSFPDGKKIAGEESRGKRFTD